ncbi:FG-GAP repeat domain-containing protein [Streptomyces sp. NPDC059352]|uniref:FG-GAP repeat domain-containing protein n=1 Tax=Streptomyces sp. NPDC059352 TaxID=3346810 RepID=UPI00369E9704
MFFQRSRRAGRIAACTALALSAGMLLTGTASADTPAPRASVEDVAPSFTPPKLALPKQGAARAGAAGAAEAASLPLSDLDGDGIDDLIFRASDGELYTNVASEPFDLFRYEDVAKDIVPIGDQGGETTQPEVLVLSEDGTLTLYQDADATGTPYQFVVGGGWQIYNKVTSPGDVNGDGRADVVARTKDGVLYLYLATGDLAQPLGARTLIGGGWGVYDQLMGLGDGNGDGRADLYARDGAGTLWWYAGTGDTTRPFGARTSVGGGWGIYNQILPAGDGDLLARDNAGTLYFYLGNGNGTLAARQQIGAAGDGAGITQFAGGGNNPYTGKDGVIAGTSGGSLYWYGNTTTGKLGARELIDEPGGWAGLRVSHLSSMNSDSFSDLAILWGDGEFWVDYISVGNGWGIYNTVVGPGDLSGDGKGDLLARDASGVLYLYRGNGKGDALSARQKVGTGWGVYNKILGAGDYTGDGRTDLVARTTGGDLYLYAGTGSATTPFKARVKIGTGWQTYKQLAAPGDLNADGKADLLGVTSGGDLYRYLNTTPGKFTARTKIGYGFQGYNSMS